MTVRVAALVLACVSAAALGVPSHAQSGTGCEALLLQKDLELYARDEQLAYHFFNSVDEETYSRLQFEAGGSYGLASGDLENLSELRSAYRSRTSETFTHSESLFYLTQRTSQEAIAAFVECRHLDSDAAYLEAVATGDPEGLRFDVIVAWNPARGSSETALTDVSTTAEHPIAIAGLPGTLPWGTTAFSVTRRSASDEINISIGGSSQGRGYTAPIFVPRWREVELAIPFPVHLSDLTPEMCATRGDSNSCITEDRVLTPPPPGGTARVSFAIPPGSRRFDATLMHYDPANCGASGAWAGVVVVDGDEIRRENMGGIGSMPITVDLPEGARTLELRGVDTDGNGHCDDPGWVGALFRN